MLHITYNYTQSRFTHALLIFSGIEHQQLKHLFTTIIYIIYTQRMTTKSIYSLLLNIHIFTSLMSSKITEIPSGTLMPQSGSS